MRGGARVNLLARGVLRSWRMHAQLTPVDPPRCTLRPTSRGKIIGRDPRLAQMVQSLDRAARSSCTVLVTGESGTGKEMFVAALHDASPRASKPLVTLNCGAIPEALLESELFGHAKGSFTGAHATRVGRVAAAEGGTLFLDEIGELPLTLQVKLLRLLQQREYSPVGDTRTVTSDIRVVAATNRDLAEEVRKGTFREDLYYRLHTFPILVPSLRERTEDIVPIATAVLATATQSGARQLPTLTPAAVALLESMAWPGNVAQLEAIVRRAAALAGGATVEREHLLAPAVQSPAPVGESTGPSSAQRSHDEPQLTEESIRPFEEEEQELLSRALRATKGNVRRAAQLLGIGRATLYRKIQQYRLRLQ